MKNSIKDRIETLTESFEDLVYSTPVVGDIVFRAETAYEGLKQRNRTYIGEDIDHTLSVEAKSLERLLDNTQIHQLLTWQAKDLGLEAAYKKKVLRLRGTIQGDFTLEKQLKLWTLCHYFAACGIDFEVEPTYTELYAAYPYLEKAAEDAAKYAAIPVSTDLDSKSWQSIFDGVKLLGTDPWTYIQTGNREQRRSRANRLATSVVQHLRHELALNAPTTPTPGNTQEIVGWLAANMFTASLEELADWYMELPAEYRLFVVKSKNNKEYSNRTVEISILVNARNAASKQKTN